MKLLLPLIAISALLTTLLLTGCTVGFVTKSGTRITVGFNPTAEQIEGFRK